MPFTDAGVPILETLQREELTELYGLADENQQAAWFRRRAFAFISEYPAAFARQYAQSGTNCVR